VGGAKHCFVPGAAVVGCEVNPVKTEEATNILPAHQYQLFCADQDPSPRNPLTKAPRGNPGHSANAFKFRLSDRWRLSTHWRFLRVRFTLYPIRKTNLVFAIVHQRNEAHQFAWRDDGLSVDHVNEV
jgi:hypothetical protein